MRFSFPLIVFTQSPDGYLHDVDPAAGATGQPQPSSGTPTAAPTSTTQPAAGSPSQLPASGQAPASGQPASGQAQPPASATARTDDWKPPTRDVWESTEKARRAAIARTQTLEANLKAEQRRVQALAGVAPVKPEDAQKAEVAEAFFELFPQFKMFQDPAVADRLAQLLARGDELSQASDHVWDGLTRRTLDTVAKSFCDETGTDEKDLNDRDRRELAALFFQMGADDPEVFRKRYEREDPKLIEEFMARLKTRYFDPVRRNAAAGMVRGQPRVPNGGPSRPVVTAPPNINFGDREAVENAAVEYMKSRGHLQEA